MAEVVPESHIVWFSRIRKVFACHCIQKVYSHPVAQQGKGRLVENQPPTQQTGQLVETSPPTPSSHSNFGVSGSLWPYIAFSKEITCVLPQLQYSSCGHFLRFASYVFQESHFVRFLRIRKVFATQPAAIGEANFGFFAFWRFFAALGALIFASGGQDMTMTQFFASGRKQMFVDNDFCDQSVIFEISFCVGKTPVDLWKVFRVCRTTFVYGAMVNIIFVHIPSTSISWSSIFSSRWWILSGNDEIVLQRMFLFAARWCSLFMMFHCLSYIVYDIHMLCW